MDNDDRPISTFFKDTPEKRAIEQSFFDGALNALNEAGLTAIQFLDGNPGVSKIELAKRLDRGTTARGLMMVIYHEAESAGIVRKVAKDMLIRLIRDKFPQGWTTQDSVRPSVKLGSWDRLLCQCVVDQRVGRYGFQIIQDLAINNPPPEGWLPNYPSDERIDRLFDKFWPAGSSAALG
jgi:hypothetical protein